MGNWSLGANGDGGECLVGVIKILMMISDAKKSKSTWVSVNIGFAGDVIQIYMNDICMKFKIADR